MKWQQFPTSATKISPKEEERKDESPASWRLGLRKTGSYGALAEITAAKEAQKEKDTAGVIRSASSPRLSSSLDNKEKVIYFNKLELLFQEHNICKSDAFFYEASLDPRYQLNSQTLYCRMHLFCEFQEGQLHLLKTLNLGRILSFWKFFSIIVLDLHTLFAIHFLILT